MNLAMFSIYDIYATSKSCEDIEHCEKVIEYSSVSSPT